MQKLGFLASIILLTAVIIGPIGLSNAQTVDTNKDAKMKHEEIKTQKDQDRADRFAAQQQKAAEIKAKMMAKKAAAQKELEALIAARAQSMKKEDIPQTADVLAKIRAMAKEQIEARKSSGPSKVQVALEQDREALKQRLAEHQKMIPTTPDKDTKSLKEEKQGRAKTLKSADAVDQLSKEEALKAEEKKAQAIRDAKYAEMHHKNRK